MDDSQIESAALPKPAQALAPAPKPEWVAQVIGDILQGMELSARIETKDGADGGIAVALHFAEPVPGTQPGRRSPLMDSLQFVVNKLVNRPGAERRWVTLGVGMFPEPRSPKPERPLRNNPPPPQAARPSAPAARTMAREPAAVDEATLTVSEDLDLLETARRLAEKSARLGRYFGIASMRIEDRARFMKATSGISGVRVLAEGEGRNRRLVLAPERPSPMPKQRVPGVIEEEEL